MRGVLLAVALLLPLSGCMDAPAPAALEAKEAFERAQDGLQRFEVAMFLGIGATDAAVDPALLEAPGVWGQVLAHFGAGADDGRPGDGRAAAWILTHFVWDRESDASGGLFTQVRADGGVERLFVAFPGPYRGAPGLGVKEQPQGDRTDAGPMGRLTDGHPMDPTAGDGLERRLSAAAAAFAAGREAAPEDGGVPAGPVLCGLGTDVASWHLGSVAAASAALRDPLLRGHAERHPGGEFTYFYLPALSVEPGCEGNLTDPGNHWTVSHTQLDADPDAGLAEVVVQAETGQTLPGTLRPMRLLPPMVVQGTMEAEDDAVVLPTQWHVEAVEVDVPAGMHALYAQTVRHKSPEGVQEAYTQLVGPDGEVRARHEFGGPLHRTTIDGPQPGAWRIEYHYRTVQPLGVHEVAYVARAM